MKRKLEEISAWQNVFTGWKPSDKVEEKPYECPHCYVRFIDPNGISSHHKHQHDEHKFVLPPRTASDGKILGSPKKKKPSGPKMSKEDQRKHARKRARESNATKGKGRKNLTIEDYQKRIQDYNDALAEGEYEADYKARTGIGKSNISYYKGRIKTLKKKALRKKLEVAE